MLINYKPCKQCLTWFTHPGKLLFNINHTTSAWDCIIINNIIIYCYHWHTHFWDWATNQNSVTHKHIILYTHKQAHTINGKWITELNSIRQSVVIPHRTRDPLGVTQRHYEPAHLWPAMRKGTIGDTFSFSNNGWKTTLCTSVLKNSHNSYSACGKYFFMKLTPLCSADTELLNRAKKNQKNPKRSLFPYSS